MSHYTFYLSPQYDVVSPSAYAACLTPTDTWLDREARIRFDVHCSMVHTQLDSTKTEIKTSAQKIVELEIKNVRFIVL